jgi:O-antigen ligase
MAESGSAVIAADHPLARVTALALFVTLAGALVVPEVLNRGLTVLVALAIVWSAWHWRGLVGDLHRLEAFFLLAIALFVAGWFIAWAGHGLPPGGEDAAERIPKLVAGIPLFLYLRRIEGLASAWWGGLVAGAVLAGAYALWFSLSGQVGDYQGRVPGPTNPIYFGGLSLAYGLMLIPAMADDRRPTPMRALIAAAILLAFVANGLSASRGAWPAIPVLLGIYLFTAGRGQPMRWRLGAPLIVLGLSLLLWLAPAMPISERLDETLLDMHLIGTGEIANGTLGLRLQMWQVAAGLIAESPLAGAGPGSFRIALIEAVEAGRVSAELMPYGHAHNQYLTTLIDGGAGLLLLLIALLAAPIVVVSPLSRRYPRQCRQMAWCAIVTGAVFMALCLSESMFVRNAGVSWFYFLAAATTAIAGGSRPAARAQEAASASESSRPAT